MAWMLSARLCAAKRESKFANSKRPMLPTIHFGKDGVWKSVVFQTCRIFQISQIKTDAVQIIVRGSVAGSLSDGIMTSDKTTSETGNNNFAHFPSDFCTLFPFAIYDTNIYRFDLNHRDRIQIFNPYKLAICARHFKAIFKSDSEFQFPLKSPKTRNIRS